MQQAIEEAARSSMDKSIAVLEQTLAKVRTGRANPALLDAVRVSFYGTQTPLNQIATITAEGPRTLLITPWDKNALSAIEKAIANANLGLNPTTVGTLIRLPMPPLTQESRRSFVKLVKEAAEAARISVRNARRDANQACKALVKEKQMTEDEEHRLHAKVQKLTDQAIAKADQMLSEKESELMTV